VALKFCFGSVLDAALLGHEERAWHVAWNPKKPLLASCSADKSVRIWAYNQSDTGLSYKFKHLNTISTGHTKTVRAVAWPPHGGVLATASFDSNIGIWEPEAEDTEDNGDTTPRMGGDWECAALLEGHETECKSIAYSSSGTFLASCSRDKTVWIWEGLSSRNFLQEYQRY
jgi:cytosolic iron-sulfur protein assembly protein CIAO1